MTNHLFTGIAKWAKVRTGKHDDLSESWTIDVYLNDESMDEFLDSGIRLKVREDEDGKFVQFRRKLVEMDYRVNEEKDNEPPMVYLKDAQTGEYHLWKDGLVGNGSLVTVAVESYPTKKYGIGHRLNRVFIDKLVEYIPEAKVAPESASLPF